MSRLLTTIFGGAALIGSSNTMAQSFGLEYITEWQTDFSGGYDWLNLLSTSVELSVTDGLVFEAATISTAKTCDDVLIEDLQTYSNIEAGNIPLTFSRLGFGLEIRQAEMFIGINNVNEDYFISPLTSFFTNSSCGISPTISCNYDIANYPLAAWCVHYKQKVDSLSIQTSLYPGQGYSRLLGHSNLFSLDFKRDGIFSISSIDYNRNGIYCVLGVALHYGVCMDDIAGASQEASSTFEPQKHWSASPWVLTEINLPHNLGLHLHGSYSTVKQGCKGYAGAGLIYNGRTVKPGVALNYANFTHASEYTAEITCHVPLLDKFFLQPALHIVKLDGNPLKCVGMLRMALEI